MKFVFEKARQEHRKEILWVMEEVASTIKKKEWFVAGDEEYIKEVLESEGFIILAREEKSNDLAGFFIVVIPEEDYMGSYANVSPENKDKIIYMDTVAVKDCFRGNNLQEKMLQKAEEELVWRMKEKCNKVQYRLCSVHPENTISLLNMTKNGYEIQAKAKLYGGLERYVLCKKVILL